jgi:hypothetical protein
VGQGEVVGLEVVGGHGAGQDGERLQPEENGAVEGGDGTSHL